MGPNSTGRRARPLHPRVGVSATIAHGFGSLRRALRGRASCVLPWALVRQVAVTSFWRQRSVGGAKRKIATFSGGREPSATVAVTQVVVRGGTPPVVGGPHNRGGFRCASPCGNAPPSLFVYSVRAKRRRHEDDVRGGRPPGTA